MEESKGNVGEQATAEGSSSPRGRMGLLRTPAIVGSAGAGVGLLVGILIGRASVTALGDERPLVRAEAHLAESPAKAPDRAEEAPAPEYRRHLGRKLPKGARGFATARVAARPVARLVGERATMRFDIAPTAASHALTLIGVLQDAKTASLQIELDGKPIGDSRLSEGWGFYANAVPAEALSAGTHELAFRTSDGGSSVGLDSVAVIPVGDHVELAMGTGAIGAMISGFSSPSRESVWSHGQRSAVGVVLSTAEGSYLLKLRAAAIAKLAPMSVSARINGRELGMALFQKKPTVSEWAVPANTLQPGVNRIEFSYPQTATPSDYDPKSRDNRPLALRFYHLALRPNR